MDLLQFLFDALRPFVIFVAFLACSSCNEEPTPTTLPTIRLEVQGESTTEVLTVELATTPAQRAQGLMYRQAMAEDAGMLFIFPNDSRGGFWMKNTYIPLTIAYIAADGEILELKDGKPLDLTPLTPASAYRYVLEVNQGWFERHGLGAGDRLVIPEDLPAAR
jgi:uncharacterized membrane protein (UPF0127 family)